MLGWLEWCYATGAIWEEGFGFERYAGIVRGRRSYKEYIWVIEKNRGCVG